MNHQTTRPQTATEILKTAASTLGERGKQYDPAGKQERSMTAIVAAFNAIYPHNLLTVHMGWQFMSLVKMVRGATKPHADSALDQVAYAALAAECVAECLHQPVPTDAQAMAAAFSKHKEPRLTPYQKEQPAEEPTKYYVVLSQPELYDAQKEFIMEQVLAGHKVQIMSDTTARKERLEEELEEEPKPYVDPMIGGQTDYERWQGAEAALRSMRTSKNTFKSRADLAAKKVEELLVHNRSLEVQLDATHSALSDFVCRFDLNEEYMTKEQVLAGQAKHEAQVASLRNSLQISEQAAETQRGKCVAQSSRISELQTLVDNLRSSLAQATKEAPCAHNTDEPKAPRPEYVDPFDQYGDMRSPMHRLVGDRDPARGGLAYPAGKDAPTPL